MRKYINFSLLGLALLGFTIAGCDTATQEVEPIVSPAGYPLATFATDDNGTSFAEGDTITWTISVDKQMANQVQFTAHVVGGNATDDDFEVIGGLLDAYSSTTTLQIVVSVDDDPDPDETAKLEIGCFNEGTKYLLSESTENAIMEFTISNYEEGILQMSFSWDRAVLVNPNYPTAPDVVDEYSAASGFDFDIFFAYGEGYDNADPWGTFTMDVDYAATGSHPEHSVMLDTLPDGVYVIFCELWYNGFADSAFITSGYGMTIEDVAVPITAHFLQAGKLEVEVEQHESQVFRTTSAGYDNAEWDGVTPVDTYVAEVEVDGGTFIIRDYEGSTVLSGAKKGTTLQLSKRPESLRK